MISSVFKALGDLFAPEFRGVLLKAVGLTLALFVGLFILVQILLTSLTQLPWPWAETMAAVGVGLGMLVAFFFLMSPVTAIFAGIFLDEIAAKVEKRHYPNDPPGTPLPAITAILTGARFALIVLLVLLAVLPTVFFGIGAIAMVGANAYLLSREYFEMAAMRHMPVDEARGFRKANAPQVFVAGLIPAVLSVVPLANLLVPLFATSYFVHLFKEARASSV
ncbi:MAG: cysteine biosynthesis protein CysZ [Rhizobiales bacterium]|nr:cysteine biosynthesis protein CysZ [Hyphomicrobiales bacterium]